MKIVWVEGLSEDGFIYYYNIEIGEFRWEKFDDFILYISDLIFSKVNENLFGILDEFKLLDLYSDFDGE